MPKRLVTKDRAKNLQLTEAELLQEVESLRRRNQELEASEKIKAAAYRVAEAALLADDLGVLFCSIHSIIGELIPARNFYIALYDEKTDLLSFPYFVDENDEAPAPKRLGKGMTEYVLRTGQSLLANPGTFKELAEREEVVSIGAESIDWLGVPLKTRDKIIGVLTVQSYTPGCRYQEEHKNILGFVSSQVAMAIERKKVEEALKESEERYRKLIENQGEGTAIMSPDERFLQVNPAAERIFGVKPGTLQGRSLLEFLDLENQQFIQRETGKRLQGHSSVYEHSMVRSDGEKRWLLVTATPNFNKDGSYAGAFVIFRDITDRKRAQAALEESEERYREIFDTISDSLVICDSQGVIVQVNHAATRNYGYSFEEMVGMDTRKLITNEYQHVFNEFLQMVEKTGRFYGETVDIRKNGSLMNTEVAGSVIKLNGQVRLLAIVRDVTARKKAEEERKKLEELLRQSQKMEAIGTLAGGIAHDFNNILSAILGYSELTLEKIGRNSESFENIKKILAAGNRAKELVKQILAFSRKDIKEKEPVILNEIIHEVLKFLRSTLPSTIEIREFLDEQVFPVLANPTQLHQVVMNLCANAAHAMRKKGGILEITLKELELDLDTAKMKGLNPGIYQRLTFRDTGCGMPPEIVNRIFEPYFTTKNKDEGTGMGLAVVHGIVNNHNGAISVYSEIDQGTEFQLLFPVTTQGKISSVEKKVDIPGGNEHILWIDDNQALVQLGCDMLSSLGYRVTGKNNSLDALAIFKLAPHNFDLIISDQTMPKMTGVDLAQRLKDIRPDIPVLIATGYSRDIDEKNFQSLGIDGFLMKPLVKRDLGIAIRRVLDK